MISKNHLHIKLSLAFLKRQLRIKTPSEHVITRCKCVDTAFLCHTGHKNATNIRIKDFIKMPSRVNVYIKWYFYFFISIIKSKNTVKSNLSTLTTSRTERSESNMLNPDNAENFQGFSGAHANLRCFIFFLLVGRWLKHHFAGGQNVISNHCVGP